MKKHLIIGGILLAVFVLFTIAAYTVDVQKIGRQDTGIGFAALNARFDTATGEHKTLYKSTEYVGYLAALPVAVFGLLGLLQLCKRRSLKKVDADILLLGGFYVILGICYILFEKLVINYRPEFDGETALEPSYPSSHTLLFAAVAATTVMQILLRVKDKTIRLVLILTCVLTSCFVIAGRAICGVHWLTDIVGGLMLAAALGELYFALAFAAREYPNGKPYKRPFECVYAGPSMMRVYAGPERMGGKEDTEEPEE